MKKLIIFILLICVKSAYAQVVPDSVDLRSNSYSVTFENNSSIGQKFQIAKQWFATNFQNYREILITEDIRAGKIVMKPLIPYKADTYSKCFLLTDLTFECDKNQFTLKFENLKKRSLFPTMGNVESVDSVFLQSDFTTQSVLGKYHRYKELKTKKYLANEEIKEFRNLTFFENYTEEAIIKENMVNYTELQDIVAKIVNLLKLTIEESVIK